MKFWRLVLVLVLILIIPLSVKLTEKKTEIPSQATTQPGLSFAKTGNFSIGFKKLEIAPPYVWYWGWDDCNCDPKTLKCTFPPYKIGETCSAGTTGDYPYGSFGGYKSTWGFRGAQEFLDLLTQASQMKIGLGDYTKPLWFSGPILTDSQGNVYVPENESSRLYCGLQNGTENYKKVAIYNLQTAKYVQWVADLAAKIKTHANFAAITITHGLDGEARCKPDGCTHIYPNGTTVTDPCVGYEDYQRQVTDAFYRNFCQGAYDAATKICQGTMKPIYEQTSSWGDRAGWLGGFMPPMGMKFSGFVADTEGVIYGGKWRGYGLVEGFARYRNLIPTAIEPKYGNWFLDNHNEAGGQGTYWWNLEALWLRPTAIDINPAYGLRWQIWEDPDYFDLINRHLNVTAQNTPDVWIALRDTPNLCGAKTAVEFTNNPCVSDRPKNSGKVGDYDFFLTRPDAISGNKTVILTRPDVYPDLDKTIEPFTLYSQEIPQAVRQNKYARHVRRTDKATANYYMSFDVDNDYPWSRLAGQSFEATVYYLDLGSGPFYLEYKNSAGQPVQKEIQRAGSQTWKKAVVTLTDAYFNDQFDGHTDFRIYNGGTGASDAYLHMVKVKGLGTQPTNYKRTTNITCSLPNESIYQGETPLLEVELTDRAGNALGGKDIRITIDPYWYTQRVSFSQTDAAGVAKKNLDLTGLPALFEESRSSHEIEVVFPGEATYRSSVTICYLPLNLRRDDIAKRTMTASLSKTEARVGETVTVNLNLPGGGAFSVEGVGFGMPACYGTASGGSGSCTFKVGGMALSGRRNLGVIAGWNNPHAAVATNLTLKIIDDSEEAEPTAPPTSPTPTATPPQGATPTPTRTLTPTPTPSPTLTPAPSRTPTPTPSSSPKTLSLVVKLKGVDAVPPSTAIQNLHFKVQFVNRVSGQTITLPNLPQITTNAQYWVLNFSGSGLPAAGSYDLYLKGPKHVQKKFSGVTLSSASSQVLNLLSLGELPPGDLPVSPSQGGPNAAGVQDGVVNSLDAVYLTGCSTNPQESACISRADLNLDGLISALDMELMNSTIVSQRWEDE